MGESFGFCPQRVNKVNVHWQLAQIRICLSLNCRGKKVPLLSLTRKQQKVLIAFSRTGITIDLCQGLWVKGLLPLRVQGSARSPRYDLRSNLPQSAKSCSSAYFRELLTQRKSTHAQEACLFGSQRRKARSLRPGRVLAAFPFWGKRRRAARFPLETPCPLPAGIRISFVLCSFFLQTTFSTV